MSGVRKIFYLYNVTIATCLKSLISMDIFTKKEKSAILFHFFFFIRREANLEAASLVYINDFVDMNA